MTYKTDKEPPSLSNKYRNEFADFLREERRRSGLKVQDCPKGGKYQKESETAKKVPDLAYLLRLMMWFLHKKKHLPSQSRLRRMLILWALARIESVTETDKFRKQALEDYEISDEEIDTFEKLWEKYGREAESYFQNRLLPIYSKLQSEPEADRAAARSIDYLPTLDFFPEAFKPLTVIVGGYTGPIKSEPDQVYKLFRQSQSFINLHYLLRLKLDPETEIVSDQLFLELDDKERAREILGKNHLLVIGGPLVNAVSRHSALTKQLIFNFAYDTATYRWGNRVYDRLIKSGLFNTPLSVKMLYRMLKVPQNDIDLSRPEFIRADLPESVKQEIKDMVFDIRNNLIGNLQADNEAITDQFRPSSIFSPLEPNRLRCQSDSKHERAIISLGENPWASLLREKDPEHPRYALINVSGINELSTTLAVKALSNKMNFLDRPLGGILDITESKHNGTKRVTESSYEWLTSPYRVEDILSKVDNALEFFSERPDAFTLFNKTELETYKKIVEQYAGGAA